MIDIDIKNNPFHFGLFLKVRIMDRIEKALKLSDEEKDNEVLEIYNNLIDGVTHCLDSLYVNRWYVLYEMGDNDWAIADFKKALGINNENQLALEFLLAALKEKEETNKQNR